jgi:hypothetical protein
LEIEVHDVSRVGAPRERGPVAGVAIFGEGKLSGEATPLNGVVPYKKTIYTAYIAVNHAVLEFRK